MMLATKEISNSIGVGKNEFLHSLQHLSDQTRRINQKLTMKVDNEILDTFHRLANDVKMEKDKYQRR